MLCWIFLEISKKRIEGNLEEPVVILDDVMTNGSSIMEAIESVRKKGRNVAGVICVIDRQDPENLLRQNNIRRWSRRQSLKT
jgi:orotate phosphoribosyltransferase